MTYIPYLGTFFFSRYPSVALARNYSHRAKQMCPIFSQGGSKNVSYSHRAVHLCPILTGLKKCPVLTGMNNKMCPIAILTGLNKS